MTMRMGRGSSSWPILLIPTWCRRPRQRRSESASSRAAERYLEQSASVARGANDSWSLGMSLNALGDIARLRGQTGRATGFYAEALELPRVPGLVATNAIVLSNVAHLAHQEG